MNSRLVFGCSRPLADASGGLGCLLTFSQSTSACCHGGQYVSVNNLAWRSLSALTQTLLNSSAQLSRIRQLSSFWLAEVVAKFIRAGRNIARKVSFPLESACLQASELFVFWGMCTVRFSTECPSESTRSTR